MFPQAALSTTAQVNQDLIERVAAAEAERDQAKALLATVREENSSLRRASSRTAEYARDAFLEILEDEDENSEKFEALSALFEAMGWEVPSLMVEFEADVTITVSVRGKVRRGALTDQLIKDSITSLNVSMDADSDIEDFEVNGDEDISEVDAREA